MEVEQQSGEHTGVPSPRGKKRKSATPRRLSEPPLSASLQEQQQPLPAHQQEQEGGDADEQGGSSKRTHAESGAAVQVCFVCALNVCLCALWPDACIQECAHAIALS